MFIRFVTDQLDEDNVSSSGVFSAAYRLVDDDATPDYLRREIRSTLNWFSKNLPIPDRFCSSRKPHREDNGICWFKTDATECMTHVRYLVHLASECDVMVRELTTDKPGYTIYEDGSQVVAQPFASTPR